MEGRNAWRHPWPSPFRADLVQRQVAVKAQAEGSRTTRQVEALEQFAVARQHDGSMLRSDLGDLAIFEGIVVEGVEAAHAQQPGQPVKVRVSDAQHP
jgi:hypothetical protein